MDRINWLLLVLGLGNLLLWCFPGIEEPGEDRGKLQEAIGRLEKDLPEREKAGEWTKRAREALTDVPEENPGTFINRIQGLAKTWRFTLHETSQTGEFPVYLKISGVGSYKAVANLLREIGRTPSVIVHKTALAMQDDRLLHARLEMIVRTGPWRGNSPGKDRVEPLPERNPSLNLGFVDLFGRESTPEKPTIGAPRVRYLGYYSGKGQPTGIIEENLKSLLIQAGDRTPGGLRVASITPEFLEIRATQERGRVWKIPLEKPR